MFDSNLLSQINIESLLPTFVEVEIVNNLNRSLEKAFQLAHALLAERIDVVATSLPWGDEIYFSLIGILEYTLLFHAGTTFTELIFGLRRSSFTAPTAVRPGLPNPVLLLSCATYKQLFKWLRWAMFGLSPMISPEERAMRLVKERNNPASGAMSVSSWNEINEKATRSSVTIAPTLKDGDALGDGIEATAKLPSFGEQDTESPEHIALSELNANELFYANRASYGHLRFKPLSTKQKVISLLLLTLKEYVDKKLAQWYNYETDATRDAVAMREAYDNRYPQRARLKAFLVKYIYPTYHFTTECVNLCFKLMYLLELTPYTSLMHRVFGIGLRRSTPGDVLAASSPRARRAMLVARVLLMVMLFGFNLLQFSRGGVGGLLFGGSAVGDIVNEALPIPPAPVWGKNILVPEHSARTTSGARGLYDVPAHGICPICAKRVTNAAVCATSGVVGCYPCLQVNVREYHACPVTKKPTTGDQIRRIFEC